MSKVLIFLKKIDVKDSFKNDNVQQKDHSLETWVFLFSIFSSKNASSGPKKLNREGMNGTKPVLKSASFGPKKLNREGMNETKSVLKLEFAQES